MSDYTNLIKGTGSRSERENVESLDKVCADSYYLKLVDNCCANMLTDL